jgi:uncharacterized protein (DUF1697 family)
MPRYVAFLRGVSPMNCSMPELKKAFERAGFRDVKTVISSGNVVFTSAKASDKSLQKKCEKAMQDHLGKSFLTIVRSVDELNEMLAGEPYGEVGVSEKAKRIVTLLLEPPKAKPTLPIELDGATIHSMTDRVVYSSYLPTPKGPVFMTLLEKTFGKGQTTRTWATIKRVSR